MRHTPPHTLTPHTAPAPIVSDEKIQYSSCVDMELNLDTYKSSVKDTIYYSNTFFQLSRCGVAVMHAAFLYLAHTRPTALDIKFYATVDKIPDTGSVPQYIHHCTYTSMLTSGKVYILKNFHRTCARKRYMWLFSVDTTEHIAERSTSCQDVLYYVFFHWPRRGGMYCATFSLAVVPGTYLLQPDNLDKPCSFPLA
jgi:hypothetical protein